MRRLMAFFVLGLMAAGARANVLGIHTMVQDNGETDQQLDLAAELCGRGGWVKQLFYIQDGVEWSFDPKWNAFLDGARRRHLNVVARYHYLPPSWRADPGRFSSKPKDDSDRSFTTFKNLVRDFTKRLGGRVHYVELWNEPNLQGEWNDQPDANEFVRAMMAGYDGIKEADPTCRVLFPGLAPTNGTTDGRNIDNLVFLRACYQSTEVCPRDGRSFKAHFDILGNHSYGFNHPATYAMDKYSARGYAYEHSVMATYGDGAKPVLITECGYALGSQEDNRYPKVTETYRADNMVIAFRDLWVRDPRVLGAMPYFLRASERQPHDTPFFWVYDGGVRTEQFLAVRALAPSLADAPGNIAGYDNALASERSVDVLDALLVLSVALGRTQVPGDRVDWRHVTAADVAPISEPDGRLTFADASRILVFAAGLQPG